MTTQYIVTGTDLNGCENKDSVIVNVDGTNTAQFLMPNAFTPNGDGKNDCFGMKFWGTILEVEFNVYNRYGQRLFHSRTPGQCWDGTYLGAKQPPGVYVYWIRAKTSCVENVFRKGTMMLIR
jgi:gliding motility-associated-like protein